MAFHETLEADSPILSADAETETPRVSTPNPGVWRKLRVGPSGEGRAPGHPRGGQGAAGILLLSAAVTAGLP